MSIGLLKPQQSSTPPPPTQAPEPTLPFQQLVLTHLHIQPRHILTSKRALPPDALPLKATAPLAPYTNNITTAHSHLNNTITSNPNPNTNHTSQVLPVPDGVEV